jgi:Ca2+-binding RTX toxin-like protein
VLAAQDYSNNTVTISNIETIDITASGITLAGSDMHNSSSVITGDQAGDTLNVLATTSTGETINISNTATTGAVTMTGLAGADSLTGSATTATTFTGAAGSDVIVGGSAADTVNVLLEAAAADGLTLGGGADSIVIDNASAAGTVSPILVTDYNAGTVATNVDVLTVDESAINAMTTVTALSDTNDTDSDANAAVVVILTADASTVATCDLVVLSQDYATDAAALAGMATAGSDTFTMGGTLDNNDAILIAYYTGSHTNIAVATTTGGTSSDSFDSVETILTMQNVDNTAVLNTGDVTIVA